MTAKRTTKPASGDAGLMELIRAIASHERKRVVRLLSSSPSLACQAIEVGATRSAATDYFLTEIKHYVYAGDTALHVAGAAYDKPTAERLIAKGARPRARNRRGAEPLHYAADSIPGSPTWDPDAQTAVIECLISAGAEPNSADTYGVTPLHRAVRTRCGAAVRALLRNGADPIRKNGNGSTPLHLAVQTTGRGGSGSSQSREQQAEIIRLLLQHGARATDANDQDTTVAECATSEWIRDLLRPG